MLEQTRADIYTDQTQIKGNQIRLGIEAPATVLGRRGELLEKKE
ncbi:carbon storage regulator [Pseudomonas corrugata]